MCSMACNEYIKGKRTKYHTHDGILVLIRHKSPFEITSYPVATLVDRRSGSYRTFVVYLGELFLSIEFGVSIFSSLV